MKSGIYKIFNKINLNAHVGSAVNLKAREQIHKSNLRNNKHPNKFLQRSWNFYGETEFDFVIIEFCSKENLLIREQFWIDNLNCVNPHGYNANPIAGSRLGAKLSTDQIEKMKARVVSDITKARMSKAAKNKIISDEHRLKISLANKGKPKLYCRKINKWPHELGYNCKCFDCSAKKREYHKLYSRQRRAA